MHVLSRLADFPEHFSEKTFSNQKILLLNAGGQSQRLPSSSILGKIFMTLPLGNPPYSLLELKLACYLPFLERMKPGIFLAGADTIEVFDLGERSNWNFFQPGFTAIAHPSTLEIGKGHGVFVFEESQTGNCIGDSCNKNTGNNIKHREMDRNKYAQMKNCVKVLQKPSEDDMKKEGAVITTKFDDGSEEEIVYTDSCFFIDHMVVNKLIQFYRENAPLECEIDAYGDFMQPLGLKATKDYIKNVQNVSKVDPKLIQTREKIYHLLHGTPLNILQLNVSRFYHLGTFAEYIYHLTEDQILAKEIGLTLSTFNKILKAYDQPPLKRSKTDAMQGCLMHNVLHGNSSIAEGSVVEFCHFSMPVVIGKHCVISNCFVTSSLQSVVIPDNLFLHTIPTNINTETQFVTIFQHVEDNMKAKKDKKEAGSILFMKKTLTDLALSYNAESEADFFDDFVHADTDTVTLWDAKLFPLCESMQKSFSVSLAFVHNVTSGRQNSVMEDKYQKVSMRHIIKCSDIEYMLGYRDKLHASIISENNTDP